MRHVEVEPGVRMAYQDIGAGRPVVLVHGWTMSHQVWDTVVQDLAPCHRLILPDLRGHGDSDKPIGDYSPERHAADLGALMEHLDLRDATLLGWSFGGMATMRAAAAHADRIAQAVLLNAAGPKYLATEDFPHGHAEADLAEWLRRERDELAPWRRFTMESMPVEPYDELFTQWLWTQSMRAPTWAAGPMLDAFARADLRADLDDIEVPVLVMHGVHDAWCVPEAARYVADRVAHGQLVEFAASGHSPQWEERDAFTRALRGFLDRVGR
jgi:non-heme chloroperoxidase